MLLTELWPGTGGRRSRGRFDGGRGRRSRVRGLAGHSHNEKNLAAAHCVLVMRNMCCRGALLLISGGSQAFHARLVIGPEGACIRGDSNCERAGREFGEGEQRERVKAYAPVPLPCSSCSFSAMIKRYCRQGTELQMSVLWQRLELESTALLSLRSPRVAIRSTADLHFPV